MYTYTQNRIPHHEDCPARSLYPWKRSETRLRFKNFGLFVDDQGNGFANEQGSLVLWPRLNSVLLANQIEFLDMFWWFDGIIKNILYFRDFIISTSCRRQAFPRELVKRVGGEQKCGIHSETFARQATPWTLKLFDYLYTLIRPGYKRITHRFMFKVVMHCFRIASSSLASSTTVTYISQSEKKALYLSVKDTNWRHNFYFSWWRRDRHFTWSSEPRASSGAASRADKVFVVPSSRSYSKLSPRTFHRPD